jgi:hypothetical protein
MANMYKAKYQNIHGVFWMLFSALNPQAALQYATTRGRGEQWELQELRAAKPPTK